MTKKQQEKHERERQRKHDRELEHYLRQTAPVPRLILLEAFASAGLIRVRNDKCYCTTCGEPIDPPGGEVCDSCIKTFGWPDAAPELFCNDCGAPLDQGGLCSRSCFDNEREAPPAGLGES